MKKTGITFLFASIFFLACAAFAGFPAYADGFLSRGLPEFTSSRQKDWINSKPLKKSFLNDKVSVVYFWAFDCWNSYRSFPWLLKLEKRFANSGFQLIGIHTPEFEREKSRKNLEAKVREFNLTHPVMMDNDFRYWRKMQNRYWPAFYIVDRDGRIVYKMIGETHIGQKRAEQFEEVVEGLIGR